MRNSIAILLTAAMVTALIFLSHGDDASSSLRIAKKPCAIYSTLVDSYRDGYRDIKIINSRFSSFSITETVDKNDTKSIDLFFRGRLVWSGFTFSTFNPVLGCADDFPLVGYTTYYFSYYSGGAHCCESMLVAVVSEDIVVLSEIEYGDFPGFGIVRLENASSGGLIQARETRFAYYDMPHYGMCFAESPAPRRLLVYENGAWRPDRPGEFPRLYEKWLHEEGLIGDKTGPLSPADAVSLAYYMYMLGASVEAVQAELEERIVPKLRVDAAFLAHDIDQLLRGFMPVSNKVLDCNAGCPEREGPFLPGAAPALTPVPF